MKYNLDVLKEDICAYVLKKYPEEAVLGIKNQNIIYYENIHENPVEHFRIDPIKFNQNIPDILIHSHTSNQLSLKYRSNVDPRTPSLKDMQTQDSLQIPFGILSSDGENCSDIVVFPDNDHPLIGRPYIHGVYDCYTIIQSFYWQKFGIELMSVPREYMWWNDGGVNLYDKYYQSAGFFEVSEDELRYGDMILISISSTENNHGAVYIGDNKILQHMDKRLSQEYSFSRWRNSMTKFLRHKEVKNHAT